MWYVYTLQLSFGTIAHNMSMVKKHSLLWWLTRLPLLALYGFYVFAATAQDSPAPPVIVVPVQNVIGPATVELVQHAVKKAEEQQAGLIVLTMDTPGGLDSSMRIIIKEILASPIPVVTYVSPDGARAASAGTYILYASHIAAMTHASNLGAATPVSLTGDNNNTPPDSAEATHNASAAKAVNDATAYIRSLAQLRGRNQEFAEQAVRNAASLSADEALQQKVIDLIANNLPELLQQLDGKTIQLNDTRTVTLQTTNAPIIHIEPGVRHALLSLLTNPQIALFLVMIGLYALIYEFTSPGFGISGLAGFIFILVALYALQLLPVNWLAFALVILGVILMIIELLTPSFGLLGLLGVLLFIPGALLLIDSDIPQMRISLWFAGILALVSYGTLALLGGLSLKLHRRPAVSGQEFMIGQIATIIEPASQPQHYWVQVLGERWLAACPDPLAAQQQVQVTAVSGLTLQVAILSAHHEDDTTAGKNTATSN